MGKRPAETSPSSSAGCSGWRFRWSALLLLASPSEPTPREIAGRACDAAAAFLQLHPLPNDGQPVDN